jgi:hypothetical protein
MKLEQAMMLLQGLTTREIREFMRARLPPRDADSFDVLIQNVSHDVLLLVSARALTRLGALPVTNVGKDGGAASLRPRS